MLVELNLLKTSVSKQRQQLTVVQDGLMICM